MKPISIPSIVSQDIQEFMRSAQSTDPRVRQEVPNILKRILSKINRSKYPDFYATILFELGTYLLESSNGSAAVLRDAISRLEESRQIRAKEKNTEEFALVNLQLGRAYLQLVTSGRLENLPKAIASLNIALDFYNGSSGGNRGKRELARINVLLGDAYTKLPTKNVLEDLRSASVYYSTARGLYNRSTETSDYIAVTLKLADTLTNITLSGGNQVTYTNQSIELYKELLATVSERSSPQLYATVAANLGSAYLEIQEGENHDQAIVLLDTARRLFGSLNNPIQVATATLNLGRAYVIKGDSASLDRAIGLFVDASAVFQEHQSWVDYALTNINLGLALKKKRWNMPEEGDAHLNDAVKAFNAALAVYNPMKQPGQHISTRMIIGNTYLEEAQAGKYDLLPEAFLQYMEALTVYNKHQISLSYPIIAQTLTGLSQSVLVALYGLFSTKEDSITVEVKRSIHTLLMYTRSLINNEDAFNSIVSATSYLYEFLKMRMDIASLVFSVKREHQDGVSSIISSVLSTTQAIKEISSDIQYSEAYAVLLKYLTKSVDDTLLLISPNSGIAV